MISGYRPASMSELISLSKISSLTLLSLSVMMVGCSKPSEKEVKEESAPVATTAPAIDEKMDEKTEAEAPKAGTLTYSAEQTKNDGEGKTLTIYSYDSFTSEWGAGPKLKEFFEKDCACTLEFVPFEDGVTMFNRLRMEGDKPKADVIIGLDNNLLKEAEKSGLFASSNVNLTELQLPTNWTNQTFVPFDYGQYSFIYDKEKLEKPPTSLKELVDNQEVSIIYQDPRTSTVGRGLLAWVNNVYGDKSAEAWGKLAKHTVTVGKGWSESYGAFLKGESDMVLSYSTSPLYHQMNDKTDKYVSAQFDEGHIVQIELASRLKASDTPELADDFLAFMITPEAQKTIATSNVMLPVIKTDINEPFNEFTPHKTLDVPMPEDKASKEQIKVWQQAVSQ